MMTAILNSTMLDWKNFTHSFWLNLMMAVILNSAMLDSDTLFSSLRFTQKHSHSTLTLTQTNSIWLKLIHSDSTWWLAAILNSTMLDSDTAILDSDTFLSFLRFTPKHSPSTLTQTNSIWHNLMMTPILNSAILDSAILHKTLTQT